MALLLTLRLAWRGFGRNKLRTALTMLGVIIGVAAVVATLAIGLGARASVQAQIATLGSNVIMLFNGTTTASGARVWGTGNALTAEDADAIRAECPSVALVSVTCVIPAGGAQHEMILEDPPELRRAQKSGGTKKKAEEGEGVLPA